MHSVHIISVPLTHLTQKIAQGFVPLGMFLDRLEGELKNSKHILVIRGLKSITYQSLSDHCWIHLSVQNVKKFY